LQRARRLARPGSRVILLSDGFCADPAAEAPLSLLAEHCDVAAIFLADPLEQAAPPPARYAVRGDGGNVLLDFAAQRLRTRWPQLFAERRDALLGMLKRRALRSTVLDTRAEPESALPRILGVERRAVAASAQSA
jgi:GAF domain-containing protein